MFDEDHPPVDSRSEDWRNHILGGDNDYSPEEQAHDEAMAAKDMEKIIQDLLNDKGIINA